MTQQIINLGTADKGNGDVLRTAFGKVNANFAELYNQIATSVVVGATAPTGPEEGALWWNSESGRMYVYYGTAWVDASPVDGAGISSTNQLVNSAYTVSLGTDGSLTFPSGILADLGGAEFGTGFSLTTDGDQAIIGASNLISLETSGGYGQLHLTQDTETDKGRVEIFFQNGPGVLWIFDEEDSSLTFPDTTKQTTAWTGITGFGEGFGLTDADKIVTNKLYSTNLTQPTQHYRLELDTNGVVVLPDGSIINGSTIRGVAGTGELNYTGITIGPNSNDAEKTWMWVDHANAYISTNNSANTWTFGNNGNLTFPDNTVQTTAYLGITNKAGPSATIAVGSIMTRNDLSVRVTNNSNTLDLEIKYSSPDGQRLVSAYKSYPSVANIYSGRTLKAANNTTWDLIGNLPLEGDSLGFTFTDHSMLKVYRVTVVADIMPGGGGGGALGEVFCTIEELK